MNEWKDNHIERWDILCYFCFGHLDEMMAHFVWPYCHRTFFVFSDMIKSFCILSPSSVSNVSLVLQISILSNFDVIPFFCIPFCVICVAESISPQSRMGSVRNAMCGVIGNGKAGRLGWIEICLCKSANSRVAFSSNDVWLWRSSFWIVSHGDTRFPFWRSAHGHILSFLIY